MVKESKFFEKVIELFNYKNTKFVGLTQGSSGICAIKKFHSKHLIVPCGKTQREDILFKQALKMITDSHFDQSQSLEQHSWTRCTKSFAALLVPDGDHTLFHSLSISIFGVSDKNLLLKKCLIKTIKDNLHLGSKLCQTWTTFIKKEFRKLGKNVNTEVLEKDWIEICNVILELNANSNNISASDNRLSLYLLQFKLFVMSQICGRALVAVGINCEEFKSSVYFPSLIPENDRTDTPIYLAYHRGKFAPLVMVDERPAKFKTYDNCIPLMDSNFNLFCFPFLLDGENIEMQINKFGKFTKIAFTTHNRIKEIPAIRIPFQDLDRLESTELDINEILHSCFASLQMSQNPTDVQEVWNYSLNFTTDQADQFPEANSQTAIDFDNRSSSLTDIATRVKSMEMSSSSQGFETTEQSLFFCPTSSTSPDPAMEVNSQLSLQCSDWNSDDEEADSSFCDSRPHVGSYLNSSVSSCLAQESNFNSSHSVEYVEERRSLDSITSDGVEENLLRNQVEDIEETYFNHECQEFEDENLNETHPNNSSNSILRCLTENHVIITNPHLCKTPRFTLQLDHIKVSIRLYKHLETRVTQIAVDNPSRIQVIFVKVSLEEMDVKLVRSSGKIYNLCIKHSTPLILEEKHGANGVSSLWEDDNEIESRLVDVRNHHLKCRTAGCLGFANRGHQNLCNSCHESWLKLNFTTKSLRTSTN